MPQVTIENPILNSAFAAPARHFKFDNDGITTETEEKRRPSAFFMPIARARKKGEQAPRGQTPPVFVVVCSNTTVSKLVFDWIAGWDTGRTHPEGAPLAAAGRLPLFTNVDHDRWTARPNSILVDSEQLESGDAMSAEFKALASVEIEEFKAEYRARFPGRSADDLTDEDLLREVMNTVGKAGKLGEHVRCVVSVSMLTEGWDANTVTHILGVRALGTQLLCEQVVGRGLRRMSYAADAEGRFEPEYAEVYGVPFSFLPCSGVTCVDPTVIAHYNGTMGRFTLAY